MNKIKRKAEGKRTATNPECGTKKKKKIRTTITIKHTQHIRKRIGNGTYCCTHTHSLTQGRRRKLWKYWTITWWNKGKVCTRNMCKICTLFTDPSGFCFWLLFICKTSRTLYFRGSVSSSSSSCFALHFYFYCGYLGALIFQHLISFT